MLSKMLLCIHPTGVPSNKWPWSIWPPWAFLHYPRVCLQSHVAKLHLYLCQWKKFPSGNISRNQGKDLSNVLRSEEVTAGSQPHLPFSPTPAKKCLVFFPKDYPITLYRVFRGSPWVVFGHVAPPMTDKLVFWVTEALPLPHLTAVRRRTGEKGPPPPRGDCNKGIQKQTALVLWLMFLLFFKSLHPAQHPWGTKVRPVLTSQAVTDIPRWAGQVGGKEACFRGWTWGQEKNKMPLLYPLLCALQSDRWDLHRILNGVSHVFMLHPRVFLTTDLTNHHLNELAES